jgi:hypothetical protein
MGDMVRNREQREGAHSNAMGGKIPTCSRIPAVKDHHVQRLENQE